ELAAPFYLLPANTLPIFRDRNKRPALPLPHQSMPLLHQRMRSRSRIEADCLACRCLTPVEGLGLELMNEIMEQAVPVDLRLEMHEDRAKANRRAVHEDEFARRRHWAEAAQFRVHALRHLAAIDAAFMFMDAARLVFEQRTIDEMCPAIEDINDLVIE